MAEKVVDILGEPLRVTDGFKLERPNARGTFVLFHGLTGMPTEVEDLAARVHDNGFNVLVPRLSGHNGEIAALKHTHVVQWLADAEQALTAAEKISTPIFVGGLSFGALLSLYLAAEHPSRVAGAVLLSPPLRFRSLLRECWLKLLAFLPEAALDRLGTVRKQKRSAAEFVRPRNALPVHSIAAGVRLMVIRKMVMAALKNVRCPVMVIQDPDDHHLSAKGVQKLIDTVQNEAVDTIWLPGGQHEITIGLRHEEVENAVVGFLQYHTRQGKDSHAA